MIARALVAATVAAAALAACQPAPIPPPTPVITVAARVALPIAIVDRRPARTDKGPQIAAYPGPTPTEEASYP